MQSGAVTAADQPFLSTYLPYLLRRADQSISASFYDVLTHHGIARSEWRVLAVLHEFGPLPVLEVADAALSPQPTVTHALRRLEQRGLVTRTDSETDRRQRIVTITEQGFQITQTLIDEARDLAHRVLADIPGLDDLAAQLRTLTDTVKHRAELQTRN
jgi:DNA-binding MarR family transcriptional regulator